MSYILDALKKAERERGISQVPTLMTVHDFRGARRNRRAAVAGGLLAGAAALGWFFLRPQHAVAPRPVPSIASAAQEQVPDRSDVRRAQESAAAAVPPSPEPRIESPARAEAGRVDSAGRARGFEPRPAPRAIAIPRPELSSDARAEAPRAQEQRPREVPPVERVRPTAPTPVAPPNSPPGDRATPAPGVKADNAVTNEAAVPTTRPPDASQKTLREAMAKMTLNILVFEEAETQRKVYINGKRYVKGDLIDGLYLVESITAEGAVLSYQGERALLRPN